MKKLKNKLILFALVLSLSVPNIYAYCSLNTPVCSNTPTIFCTVFQNTTFIPGNYTTAIEICADGITLDCNNAVLRGASIYDEFNRGIFITPNRQNVTIKNCQVTHYFGGIYVTGHNNTIENVKVFENNESGIHIIGKHNKIRNLVATNNMQYGIRVLDSFNSFNKVIATGNGKYGILFESFLSFIFTNNLTQSKSCFNNLLNGNFQDINVGYPYGILFNISSSLNSCNSALGINENGPNRCYYSCGYPPTLQGTPSIGNSVNLLVSDPLHPNTSFILGMAFNTTPGIEFPDGRTVELKSDELLQHTLDQNLAQTVIGLQNSFGTLNESGQALITWNIPNYPYLINLSVYTAFAAYNDTLPFPNSYQSLSPPTKITIQ